MKPFCVCRPASSKKDISIIQHMKVEVRHSARMFLSLTETEMSARHSLTPFLKHFQC